MATVEINSIYRTRHGLPILLSQHVGVREGELCRVEKSDTNNRDSRSARIEGLTGMGPHKAAGLACLAKPELAAYFNVFTKAAGALASSADRPASPFF